MKCLKCDGELKPILKDGQSYAQCDKCGTLFTAHDLKNRPQQPQDLHSIQTSAETDEDEEYEDYSLGKIATITGWILCAIFLMFGLVCKSAVPLIAFLAAAVLISPIFRNRVYLSGKIWIPLVVVLFFTGIMTYPESDTEPKQIAEKQEAPAPKQIKASAKKEDKKDTEKEKAEQEQAERKEQDEQERLAQEQAAAQAEQERIAQEQAAAQAEQERIAQEQAAAQAEQERIAQEQAAAAQAEQERIAQEQAAAAQAEQERIAQEQAAAAQAEQERIAQEQAAAVRAEQERIAQEQAANLQVAQTSNVWLSATGEKYHSIPNCGRMNPANARQVTLAEAQQQGYEPCKNCH